MTRKLASIRMARDISDIPGADLIVKTQVDAWFCVTKRDEFKTGDLGVYFEIDSFLPSTDSRYAFLEKQFITYNGVKGARLRTIKLKGQTAQGLFLPLHLFPEIINPQVNDDVTEILGITKWEPPVPTQLSGQVYGNIPSFFPKTDEERIQNLIDEIAKEIAGRTFEKTVKLDGTSESIFKNNDDFGVCGRNWRLKETEDNSLWKAARTQNIITALESLNQNIAVQGELIGEGIQGNNENIKGVKFYCFNIFNIDEARYMTPQERQDTIAKLQSFGAHLPIAPSLGFITFPENVTAKDILDMADGPSLFAPNREGLVFKRDDGKYSFKAISNWYLMKHSDR
jgi:RNA ligase (TIGR02306 family)